MTKAAAAVWDASAGTKEKGRDMRRLILGVFLASLALPVQALIARAMKPWKTAMTKMCSTNAPT